MQLMLNKDKVLINLPLPESIETSIDRIEDFMVKEKRYLWQILLMIFITAMFIKYGVT